MKDLTKEMYFSENRLTTANELEKLANELLSTNWTVDIFRFQDSSIINLKSLGWKFEFNSRKRSAGLCSKGDKTIYVSKWLFSQNPDKSLVFENTIRHEIAHAIDFQIRGISDHGRIWQFIARQVLCTAERCVKKGEIKVTETTKYTIICDSCGTKSPSHKLKKRKSACGKCCNEHNFGRYSEKYVLRQVQNY